MYRANNGLLLLLTGDPPIYPVGNYLPRLCDDALLALAVLLGIPLGDVYDVPEAASDVAQLKQERRQKFTL